MVDTLSSQIYLSRDSIREQISDEIKTYLELENVDLTKSSFLSFMVDTFSTLTGNLLFYQLSAYREFFLTKAQLPESILNLSAFLGYNTQEASPATVNVLMTIPFGFEDSLAQFSIPSGFKFQADGNVDFVTYYTTNVTVTNNNSVLVQLIDSNNRRINLPVTVSATDFSFVLTLRQITTISDEFQIDADTREFQFVTLDVPIEGQVSSLTVSVQNPGSSAVTEWTEFDSLYLMDNTDKGYVSRRTDTGRRLSFGNGLIGVQPTPGATVFVDATTTEGEDGNVISGSIQTGERIYILTGAGVREIVDYEVINASPATGGTDEESFEEIRRNSIDYITSLNRLVTENDYRVINVVVDDIPFAQNSLPVLKRSDLVVNEISLFNGLLFGSFEEEVDNLVPMRNAVFVLPAGTTKIERGDTVTINGVVYESLFDINIYTLNSVGEYEYVMLKIEQTPNLETTFTSNDYDIYANLLTVEKIGSIGRFTLDYVSTESDSDLASCQMVVKSSGSVKNMTNDTTATVFVYDFNPYTDIPSGEQTYEFTIYDSSGDPVAIYSNKITFKQDLATFMRSNVVSDSTTVTVYDVPVIEQDYYNDPDFSKTDFEQDVMQTVITTDLSDTRMLTDFTNIKFTNTDGILSNIKYNEVTILPVIDIVDVLPGGLSDGDRYIITDPGTYQDNIVKVIDSSSSIYLYEEPVGDSIVYVTNKSTKYIYSERGWIVIPSYTIPLDLEIEVFRETTFSGTVAGLIDEVRQTVYDAFKGIFGTNAVIWRSEIIDVVQEIDGVRNCRLKKPETSIFYNFELKNLTEEQLLRYGPEYVYFKEENITVRVI